MEEIWRDLLFDRNLFAIVDIHNKVWFNAQETCIKLGFGIQDVEEEYEQLEDSKKKKLIARANKRMINRLIDKENKRELKDIELDYTPVFTNFYQKRSLYLDEGSLYYLAFRKKTPLAKKFTDYVTNDILPTLRSTGKYELESTINFMKKEIEDRDNLLSSSKKSVLVCNQQLTNFGKKLSKITDNETIKLEYNPNFFKVFILMMQRMFQYHERLISERNINKYLERQLAYYKPKPYSYVFSKHGYIYIKTVSPRFINGKPSNYFKIGKATDMNDREFTYQTGHLKKEIVCYFKIDSDIDNSDLENKIKNDLYKFRLKKSEIFKMPYSKIVREVQTSIMIKESENDIDNPINEPIMVNPSLLVPNDEVQHMIDLEIQEDRIAFENESIDIDVEEVTQSDNEELEIEMKK